MYIIKNAIYVKHAAGYVKCVLHKSMVTEPPQYYLVATKAVLDELPQSYEVVTMREIIARYSSEAVLDMPSGEA